jgi:glycosyltransferase involved in cell wall biosynthesis
MGDLLHVPAIGVGMPVYNGERYLANAIESVLCQTMADFEVVISDNASTDRTEEICRHYAAADRRVRYFRNDANLGALPNFNRVFELARGRYFKWAAHDDALKPEFLSHCVAALDAAPDAVLCQTAVEYIDESGAPIGTHRHHLAGSDSRDPATRFATLVLRPHDCYAQMGVLRRSVVERALPLGGYHGADRAFLARIALAGRFISVPEPLLKVRDHAERYSRAQRRVRDRATWYDARNKGRRSFPVWRMYGSYWKSIADSGLSLRIRTRGALALLRWWFLNFNAFRMGVDVASSVLPETVDVAERLKQSVFSPAPGPGEFRKSRKP